MKRYIAGSWVVNDLIIDNNHFQYGNGYLSENTLNFDLNGDCVFPYLIFDNYSTKGKWDLVQEKNVWYISVSFCDETIYNRDYKLEIIKENPKIIRLVAEDFILECQKSKY